MQIDVRCPRCESIYRVDQGLLGKKMRCPNAICRAIFQVRDPSAPVPKEPVTTPTPPSPSPDSPPNKPKERAGQGVPILPAEAVAPPTTASPPSVPAPPDDLSSGPSPTTTSPAGKTGGALWLPSPPPVRRAPVDIPGPSAGPLLEFPEELTEEDALDAEPDLPAPAVRSIRFGDPETTSAPMPPVRRGDLAESGTAELEGFPPSPGVDSDQPAEESPPQAARRRSLGALLLMLSTLGVLGAGGWYFVRGKQAASEADLFDRAVEHYRQAEFSQTVDRLQELNRAFPDSPKRPQYLFLAELADVRRATEEGRHEPAALMEAYDRLGSFVDRHHNDPLMKERHEDLWHTLRHLSEDLVDLAEKNQEPDLLARAAEAWNAAAKFQAPRDVDEILVAEKLRKEMIRIRKALAEVQGFREAFAALGALRTRPGADAVRQAKILLERIAPEKKAEGRALLEELQELHRRSIRFLPTPQGAEKRPPLEEDAAFLYPAPAFDPPSPAVRSTAGKITLALARGLLYALDAETGQVRWVRRLGADTVALPVSVAAGPLHPDMFLAVASDDPAVLALAAATGKVLWRHPLNGPALAPPLLAEGHVLIATLSGRIDDLDLATGRLSGFYHTGQNLRLGGVFRKETGQAFFPAEEQCVIVLDTRGRRCTQVLYTNHGPRDIPCLPILLEDPDASVSSDSPAAKGSAPENKGWLLLLRTPGEETQFEFHALPLGDPPSTAHTMPPFPARLSSSPWFDGGRLHLVGDDGTVRFLGVRQKGNRDPLLFPLAEKKGSGNDLNQGRSQVVHADLDDVWTWAEGALQRWDCSPQSAGTVPRWPVPPAVGRPLHRSTAVRGTNSPRLVLATQDPERPICRALMVDGNDARVLWRRQLGLIAQAPLRSLGSAVFVADGEGLFRLEPDGKDPTLLAGLPARHEFALESAAGRIDYLHWKKGKPKVEWISFEKGKVVPARQADLSSPPLGPCATLQDGLILALEDGFLVRLSGRDGTPTLGPPWRSRTASPNAAGILAPLGDKDFLVGDGGRGLIRWRWPEGGTWHKEAEVESSRPLVGNIVPVPLDKETGILVAEEGGGLLLLDAERLEVRKRWPLSGRLTAGPFRRGNQVGVVLDRERLVWIDPRSDGIAWEYSGLADLVGPPVLVEGALVVADCSGRMTLLDPAEGRPIGPGYQFRAAVVPTASPLLVGSDRLLLPLSDGSLALVSLATLRNHQTKKGGRT